MKKRRNITARLIRRDADDRSFDIDFWQSQGAESIFSAAWQMVHDYFLFRGMNENQCRL